VKKRPTPGSNARRKLRSFMTFPFGLDCAASVRLQSGKRQAPAFGTSRRSVGPGTVRGNLAGPRSRGTVV
jgi:hypothetical protein